VIFAVAEAGAARYCSQRVGAAEMPPKEKPERCRLDRLLVERGLAESASAAQRLIMAGRVRVDGRRVDKPGKKVDPGVELEVEPAERFVGRGAVKLEAALDRLRIPVAGLVCLDVGASTGGFTDCLLQRGARRVYALDVGHGQLHWKLRRDPRVVVMEGVNARFLKAGDIPETPSFACIDVSFISLTLILPPVTQVVARGGTIVALVKPQFEAGRAQVRRGGVVRDPEVRREVVDRIRRFAAERLGLQELGVVESPLPGPAGNIEYLVGWRKP